MREKALAIWRFAVALLLYPVALVALIWIAWTGRPVWIAFLVLMVVLLIDRSWWLILRGMMDLTKKKRPRRKPPGR